jgi:hypothetical protein
VSKSAPTSEATITIIDDDERVRDALSAILASRWIRTYRSNARTAGAAPSSLVLTHPYRLHVQKTSLTDKTAPILRSSVRRRFRADLSK